MAIYRFVVDGSADRVPEAYVYLLLCRDEDRIYIKVGQSIDPEKRFLALRNGCPVTPRSLSVVPCPGKKIALRLEQALHHEFSGWRVAGEWFSMTMDDKTEFNKRLHKTLRDHSMPSWPMKITKVSCKWLIQRAQRRRHFWKRQYRRRGRAYQDFCKDSG